MEKEAEIREGWHSWKPLRYGAGKNHNGKVFVWVEFPEKLYWRGWFTTTDGTKSACKQLAHLGFKGETVADLNKENMIDLDKHVPVMVEKQEYEGNISFVASYIGNPNKGSGVSEEVTQELKRLDLRGYMAEARKETGSPKQESFTESDIPF